MTTDSAHSSSSIMWSYLFVFSLAFTLRILFLVYIDEPVLFIKYPFFAEKLAQGESLGARLVDLSPFYLYLLTLLKKMIHVDWAAVKYIQAFIGTLNCLLLYAVGARLFNRAVGFLAACMLAVYGNLIVLESTLEPTVFVMSFNLLTIYFLLPGRDDDRRHKLPAALAAGLCAGLAIITKPNFLIFLPVGALWLTFFCQQSWRSWRKVAGAMVFASAAFFVVLPVTVRNYVMFHDFILVTADAGKVFFHGNGPGASALEGTGLPDEGFAEEVTGEPDYAHVLFRKNAEAMTGKKLSPSASSKFWTGRTLSHIKQNPGNYLLLLAKKTFYFFNDYEMHYIASAYNEYKRLLDYPFLRYGVIAAVGMLGMVLGARQWRRHFLAYGVVFVYLISCLLFLTQSRYRIPAVPYLCLFAAFTVVSFKKMIAEKHGKAVLVCVMILSFLFAGTSFLYRIEIENVDRWQLATKTYYQRDAQRLFQQGQYEGAVKALDHCLAMYPTFGPALNLRGRAYATLGKFSEAREDFAAVVALSPQLPHGYENLGFFYLLKGEVEKAQTLLRQALALGSNNEKVKQALKNIK